MVKIACLTGDPPLLCVLILPLPRSGSSMVGGVLHHLGVDMGPCDPPDDANPRGYFEDVRFKALHRAWSRQYETDPDRLRLRLPNWSPPLSGADLARYDRLIRACAQQPSWGVKDPELCYYASHFARTLRRPIRLIATIRDPAAAAASLGARRRWFSPADCDLVIDEYGRRQTQTLAELVSHGMPPPLLLDYDRILGDPATAVGRIAEHVGLPVTEAATAFVSPELRQHVAQPGDTPRNDQGLTTLTT
jgi:hypothetical protein